MKRAKRRLLVAMICYGVLIAAALYAFLPVHDSHESFILITLLLFFALLIIKTIAHSDDQD